jgi:PAS domain-containing protein
MAQLEIELILLRQVASYLATPIFLVDLEGNLLFYNEPAEPILGKRYEEWGEMPLEVWAAVFDPTDEDGDPLPPDDLPLVVAVQHRRPALGSFWITGLDGVRRHLTVAALPLVGQGDRDLGSVAYFWVDRE